MVHPPSSCSPLSSRTSHALASRQSRITVSRTLSASRFLDSQPAEESHSTTYSFEIPAPMHSGVVDATVLTGLARERTLRLSILLAGEPRFDTHGPGASPIMRRITSTP